MIKPRGWTGWMPHLFVECRALGGSWWLYARPEVGADARMSSLLAGDRVEEGDAPLRRTGVPPDASVAVLDEYTWRVAGAYGSESGNIVGVDEAAAWLRRGVSTRWHSKEPFVRVTDPRWEHAAAFSRTEVQRLIVTYERDAGHPAPATWCAVEAMMGALERDHLVRLVSWLERVYLTATAVRPAAHRDDGQALEAARRFVHDSGSR